MADKTVEERAAMSHALQVLLKHHACTRKDLLDTAMYLRGTGMRSTDTRKKARLLFASELIGDIATGEWEA